MVTSLPQSQATGGSVRVDAWLWSVRIYKTRTLATAACRAGHVRVNGERVKASATVREGDEVRARLDGFDRVLIVRRPISKRVSAALAADAAEDRSPARPAREPLLGVPLRDRGAGRPTKRDRRDLDKYFRGL